MRGSGRDLVVRGGGALPVDIGDEPPLSASGAEPEQPALVRGVSWRWLTGTVLTGVTSILLMGAALVAALNNPRGFAPSANAAVARVTPDAIPYGQKGDRIRPVQQPVASRQVMQVPTVARQGERDLIKVRPFARINTTLAGPDAQQAKLIPAFDLLQIFGEGANRDAALAPNGPSALDDQFYGSKIEGDVTVAISEFPAAEALEPAASLSTAEVEKIVRAASQVRAAGDAPLLAFLDEGLAQADPASLAVRIEIENVSSIAKNAAKAAADGGLTEKVVTVAQVGDLGALIQANGVAVTDAAKAFAALAPLAEVTKLKPGQKVRLAFANDDAQTSRLLRASVYQDAAHLATVARTDTGNFIRADEPATPITSVATAGTQPDPATTGSTFPRIHDAAYATALQQQMPKALVDQLIRILAFDVDLQAHIGPGDAMEIFHSLPDPADADVGDPEILFASLTLGGVTKRFYRYRAADDGAVDYYNEDGQSAKKFLLRKPIVDGEITSSFGYRVHPIIRERILHSGIDYSAERNTPIFAAGDGQLQQVGPNAGYGNFILIRHNNGYETAYGHMTRFAKGMTEGVRVRQGQIIGYVGSTGLSTGPHVHFEIRINGTPVDPLRVRLPQGRLLNGEVLTAYETERARIDNLLGITSPPTKVASAK